MSQGLTPKKEKKITYSCGCTVTSVSSGTLSSYCDKHNPYKNVAPKVEWV